MECGPAVRMVVLKGVTPTFVPSMKSVAPDGMLLIVRDVTCTPMPPMTSGPAAYAVPARPGSAIQKRDRSASLIIFVYFFSFGFMGIVSDGFFGRRLPA
jgi:hypothetical protein